MNDGLAYSVENTQMTEEERLAFFIRVAKGVAHGYGLEIHIDEVSFRITGLTNGKKINTLLGEIKNLAETIGVKKEVLAWL